MSPEQNSMQGINKYGFTLTDDEIAAGVHRGKVGPDWVGTGKLQREFLVAQGLVPTSKLLDVGCGALRAGILLAQYLQPGGYYGIDVNESLIRAALVQELPQAGLADRVPAENLRVTDRFECDFGVAFDFAIANSVFSHLPLNHMRLCLFQLSRVMAVGGRFYATFFEVPPSTPFDQKVRQVRRDTWPERDPYHYRRADMHWAAETVADWDVRYIGEWGHGGGQRMMQYTLRSRDIPSGSRRELVQSKAAGLRRRARRWAGRRRRRIRG